MKVAGRQIGPFLAAPAADVHAVLLFGPDQGLARTRREALCHAWLDDPGDPMAITRFSADSLRSDPARLLEEAQAYSMLGGRRLLLVSGASDGQAALYADLLKAAPLEAKVIVEGGDLAASSKLRKLFEASSAAAAIGCYPVDGRDLRAAIVQDLQAVGLSADQEALNLLESLLGSDRAIIRQEAEKLRLYAGDSDRIHATDVASAIGDSSVLELNALALSIAAGQTREVDRVIVRLLAGKHAPVSILRAVQGQWQRLLRLAADVEAGSAPEQVVQGARPPIHFKVRKLAADSLKRLPAAAFRLGLQELLEAERACKTTGLPAALICHKVLLQLASRTAR